MFVYHWTLTTMPGCSFRVYGRGREWSRGPEAAQGSCAPYPLAGINTLIGSKLAMGSHTITFNLPCPSLCSKLEGRLMGTCPARSSSNRPSKTGEGQDQCSRVGARWDQCSRVGAGWDHCSRVGAGHRDWRRRLERCLFDMHMVHVT